MPTPPRAATSRWAKHDVLTGPQRGRSNDSVANQALDQCDGGDLHRHATLGSRQASTSMPPSTGVTASRRQARWSILARARQPSRVTGSHTYTAPGSDTVSVTLTDSVRRARRRRPRPAPRPVVGGTLAGTRSADRRRRESMLRSWPVPRLQPSPTPTPPTLPAASRPPSTGVTVRASEARSRLGRQLHREAVFTPMQTEAANRQAGDQHSNIREGQRLRDGHR